MRLIDTNTEERHWRWNDLIQWIQDEPQENEEELFSLIRSLRGSCPEVLQWVLPRLEPEAQLEQHPTNVSQRQLRSVIGTAYSELASHPGPWQLSAHFRCLEHLAFYLKKGLMPRQRWIQAEQFLAIEFRVSEQLPDLGFSPIEADATCIFLKFWARQFAQLALFTDPDIQTKTCRLDLEELNRQLNDVRNLASLKKNRVSLRTLELLVAASSICNRSQPLPQS